MRADFYGGSSFCQLNQVHMQQVSIKMRTIRTRGIRVLLMLQLKVHGGVLHDSTVGIGAGYTCKASIQRYFAEWNAE